MAGLIRFAAQRTLFSSSSATSKALINGLHRQSRNAISTFPFQSSPYSTETITKSPFEANILRILRNEIEYQIEYTPPHQPATKFNSYTVEDQPGKQLMIMKAKYGEIEDIEIKVSMVDAVEVVPKPGDDSTGENVRLHISLLVCISKENYSDAIECWCSAWPDSLVIHKVYVRTNNNKRPSLYKGPHFGSVCEKLQKVFRQYLEARGVNDELCVFLHEYMINKDRIELITWLGKIKSLVEK